MKLLTAMKELNLKQVRTETRLYRKKMSLKAHQPLNNPQAVEEPHPKDLLEGSAIHKAFGANQ